MMKKILIICLLGLCSCSSDSTEEVNTGGIAGSVSDQTTGDPVATVNVTLSPGGKSTVTGSDGSFSFVDLEPDDYTIDIRKEGYKDNSRAVDVVVGRSTEAHLTIERIPAIVTADRKELDFGEKAGVNTLSFAIVNSSYEDLSWQIEHDCTWIKEIRPANGVLKLGKTETIVVIIDRELLSAGNNETVLVVRSTNGRAEVKTKAVGAERDTPRLNILDATEITSSTATLNGEVLAAGIPAYTERGFVYSFNSMPTFDNMLAKLTAPVTEDNIYSYNLRGLTLGETYYVRAYATNSVGTAYSTNEINFTTGALQPIVLADNATDLNVSDGTVTLNGRIEFLGDPAYIEKGFVYGMTNNPTISDNKVVVSGTEVGAFSACISNLQLDQKYYVRAYTNSISGITYSENIINFSLVSIPPSFSTKFITNPYVSSTINTATVVFNGTITALGSPSITEKGFVYGTTPNPTVHSTKVPVLGLEIGNFYANITGLEAQTKYYIKTYVIQSDEIIYGNETSCYIESEKYYIIPEGNIIIQKQDISPSALTWENANSLCEYSIESGYNDWRLPTINELLIMYTNRDMIGNFKTTVLYNSSSKLTNRPFYWSAEYYGSSGDSDHTGERYKGITFNDGLIGNSVGSYTSHYHGSWTISHYTTHYGRCVRTLNPTTANQ